MLCKKKMNWKTYWLKLPQPKVTFQSAKRAEISHALFFRSSTSEPKVVSLSTGEINNSKLMINKLHYKKLGGTHILCNLFTKISTLFLSKNYKKGFKITLIVLSEKDDNL